MSNVCLGKVMEYRNPKYEFRDLDMTRSAKTNRSEDPVGWPCQPSALIVVVVGAIFRLFLTPAANLGPRSATNPPPTLPQPPRGTKQIEIEICCR